MDILKEVLAHIIKNLNIKNVSELSEIFFVKIF